MKSDSLKISEVFTNSGHIHYVLPHFQRYYTWDKPKWKMLLDDAFAIYDEYDPEKDENFPEHFLGSLVLINDGTVVFSTPVFKVVDGQQRLITISLLFCALRDLVKETYPEISREADRFLINDSHKDDVQFKLLPTNQRNDRQAFQSIVRPRDTNKNNVFISDSNIPNAYEYLKKELDKKLNSDEINPEKFFKIILNSFQVVCIQLKKDENPYRIFESLNSKGEALKQADLVRNYVAMQLPTSKQEKIFTEQWQRIQDLLSEHQIVGKSRIGELTAFIRHYLAMQIRVLCSEEHVYARFRDYCKKLSSEQFINEIVNLRRFAEYYNKLLRPENEKDLDIRNALQRLNTLEIQTAYPFLIQAYDEYENQKISFSNFLELLGIIENYVLRRYVCKEATNYMNKLFPTLWRDVIDEIESDIKNLSREAIFLPTLKKILVSKNYPDDRKVKQSIHTDKLYNDGGQKKIVLILDSINRHLSKGSGGYTKLDNNPTVEHIMPQTLSQEWKMMLGKSADIIYKDYLHTLGNLTLVTSEWNSTLSNGDFFKKKAILTNHALLINSSYFSREIRTWKDEDIKHRADFLAENFLQIWASLGEFKPLDKKSHGYPVSLIIYEKVIPIPKQTWRQFTQLAMEWVIEHQLSKFQVVKRQLESDFSHNIENKNAEDWHQLSDGSWVKHRRSADSHLSLCRKVLTMVGVQDSDWTPNTEDYKKNKGNENKQQGSIFDFLEDKEV